MAQRISSTFPYLSWRSGLVVLTLTVAITVAGCGSSVAVPAPTTPTSPTTAATTTTISGVATTTTLLPPPTEGTALTEPPTTLPPTTEGPPRNCLPAQLTVLSGPTQGAAGHLARRYQLQNSSSTPCTLGGYVNLALFDSSSAVLPSTVVHQAGSSPALVTLGPGGSAYFSAVWADATGYSGATCPTSVSVEIIPPGNTGHLVVIGAGGSIQAFGGTVTRLQCGTITVTPVSASSAT